MSKKEYTKINKDEMFDFLTSQGFSEINLPNCNESVFGRRIDCNGVPLTMRVYTSIVGESSRGLGEDAIRVQVFAKVGDRIISVGGSKRVNRIATWKKNLQSRIDEMLNNKTLYASKVNKN